MAFAPCRSHHGAVTGRPWRPDIERVAAAVGSLTIALPCGRSHAPAITAASSVHAICPVHRRATGGRPDGLTNIPAIAILKHVLNQRASLDLLFQALADPSRRVMVERLCRGPASVSELAKPLAMSLPAVVQHLQVLQASGLVRSEKAGRVRTCTIEPTALRTAEYWISERRTGWERRLDRLGDCLAELPDEPQE